MDADLARGRTPGSIAGRLRAAAADPGLEATAGSPHGHGLTVSHEAIYSYIYALPKGELVERGVLLPSGRTRRRPRKRSGQRQGPIVGMVSIDQRPEEVAARAVPGHWEGDLIIGRAGASAAATLVERTTRFTAILAPPFGKDSHGVAEALIEHTNVLPALFRKSLTWDQGSEMADTPTWPPPPDWTSTSPTRTHRGSGRPTRTPTGGSAATCPRAPTSPTTSPT